MHGSFYMFDLPLFPHNFQLKLTFLREIFKNVIKLGKIFSREHLPSIIKN